MLSKEQLINLSKRYRKLKGQSRDTVNIDIRHERKKNKTQKTQHRKLKRWTTWTTSKPWSEHRCSRRV